MTDLTTDTAADGAPDGASDGASDGAYRALSTGQASRRFGEQR